MGRCRLDSVFLRSVTPWPAVASVDFGAFPDDDTEALGRFDALSP